jgi:hypothetical protein
VDWYKLGFLNYETLTFVSLEGDLELIDDGAGFIPKEQFEIEHGGKFIDLLVDSS